MFSFINGINVCYPTYSSKNNLRSLQWSRLSFDAQSILTPSLEFLTPSMSTKHVRTLGLSEIAYFFVLFGTSKRSSSCLVIYHWIFRNVINLCRTNVDMTFQLGTNCFPMHESSDQVKLFLIASLNIIGDSTSGFNMRTNEDNLSIFIVIPLTNVA